MNTTHEFTITDYYLPRHWGVGAYVVEVETALCLEHTFEEYARFSTYKEAEAYYNQVAENYSKTGELPKARKSIYE